MKNTRYFLLILWLLIVYISCGDASLFSSSDDFSYEIAVKSHETGSIVKDGGPINFIISNLDGYTTEEKPSSLTVTLFSVLDGKKVAENTIQPVSLEKDLSLNFMDIKTGQYRLVFRLNNQDNILAEKELILFYTQGEYFINSIKSLPSLINPNSKVVLSAELKIPDNSNPYFKWWSSNGVLLQKGLLTEGLDEILWQAPKEEGVYTVTLEVFPVRPIEGDLTNYSPPLVLNTELYVTLARTISQRDLSPVESYFALFHFNDNLKDSAREWKNLHNASQDAVAKDASLSGPLVETGRTADDSSLAREITVIGELKAVALNKEPGYQLNGTSGIDIPYLIIPSAKGWIQPFTISLGLSFDELQSNVHIISLSTEDGQFSLRLFLNQWQSPEASILQGGKELSLPSRIEHLQIGQPYFLSLSINPEKNGLRALWFLDGYLSHSLFLNKTLEPVTDKGKTLIGGEQGFKGIIDELGVYRLNSLGQPSTDPYLFRDAMQRKYTSGFIFANGFDSWVPTPELRVEGKAYTDGMNLTLLPYASLTLPALTLKKGPTIVNIQLSEQATFSFVWQEKGIQIIAKETIQNSSDLDATYEDNTTTDLSATATTMNAVITQTLILEITTAKVVVKKVVRTDDNAQPENLTLELNEQTNRTWEQVLSLDKPLINHQNTNNHELPLILTNTKSSPLYIDNILVYTE